MPGNDKPIRITADSPEYDPRYFSGPVFHVNGRVVPGRKAEDEPQDRDVQAFIKWMTPGVQMEPEILGGTPVFRNTLVPIKRMFDYLLAGRSLNDFLRRFPQVPRDTATSVLNSGTTLYYEAISKAFDAAMRHFTPRPD